MAKTFTGLKLQGDLGKFGQIELSDINGFQELPDGKVLSGSEYGNLILWEGTLIKALFTLPDKKPCHNGAIESVLIEGDEVMTAGTDGYIKWWDLKKIMSADPEEGYECMLNTKNQVMVGDAAQIMNLIKGDDV